MTHLLVRRPAGCSVRAAGGVAESFGKRRRRPPQNDLWGSDSHGRFSTHGANSAATVRGTRWLTVERCDGTLTRVVSGRVLVRDLRTGRRVMLTANRQYLARPQVRLRLRRPAGDGRPAVARRTRLAAALLGTALAIAVAVAAHSAGMLDRAEDATVDLRFGLRERPVPDDIARGGDRRRHLLRPGGALAVPAVAARERDRPPAPRRRAGHRLRRPVHRADGARARTTRSTTPSRGPAT